MKAFEQKFAEAKKEKRAAFMPFLVAGDPGYQTSLGTIRQVAECADMLEIGFPFSDPLADGPTIQAANSRALASGMRTEKVFELIAEARTFTNIPITVLVYANLIYQQGIENFYRKARKAGINGVLIPDMPVEESKQFTMAAKKHGIDPIFLIAQTTTNERLKKILKHASGYLYLVSVLGVTGKLKTFSTDTSQFIKRMRSQTVLPLAVGFGISTREQAKNLAEAGADGIIVGSALIDRISQGSNGKSVTTFLRRFKNIEK